jgi:hypothetical protein
MRLCIERLVPVRKGRPIIFDLPDIVGSEASSFGASRPDMTNSSNFMGFVKLAAIAIWLPRAKMCLLKAGGGGRPECRAP